jgi:hypothetical protein
MSESKMQTYGDGSVALLHQLPRNIIDCGDMVRIQGVPKPECVRQECGSEQNRLIAKRQIGPDPSSNVY